MRCLVCGKRLSLIRRWIGVKYCSDRHRQTARKLSARALRDAQDAEAMEEPWLVTAGRPESKRTAPASGFSMGSGMLLLVVIIIVILVAPPNRGGSGSSSSSSSRPLSSTFRLPDSIQKMLQGAPSFDFTEDFQTGIGDWIGQGGRSSGRGGWNWDSGRVELGKLRLWKPTLMMSNYQMMFQGQIDQKAMGWAFRAGDLENYYASKVAIATQGSSKRAEIIRYIVVDGQKSKRVALPIPFRLERGVPYQVQVRVKADRFSTMINGQVVDTWRDQTHPKGGVGFFSEPGEQALISWVRVTDGNRLFDKIPSFSLMVTPQDLLLVP